MTWPSKRALSVSNTKEKIVNDLLSKENGVSGSGSELVESMSGRAVPQGK